MTQARNQSRDRGGMLTGLLPMACPTCFFYTIQVHLSRDGTARIGLDPHGSIIHQENAPTDMTCLMEAISLNWEESLFPDSFSLCQVDGN